MAGGGTSARVGSPCNSLLWHWVACMSFGRLYFVGCLAAAMGLGQCPTLIDTRPVIVAFGDSLSAGFGAEPGKSFPDFLQKDLDAAGLQVARGECRRERQHHHRRIGPLKRGAGLQATHHHCRVRRQRRFARASDRNHARQSGADHPDARRRRIESLLAGMTLPPNYGPDYIKPFQQIYARSGGEIQGDADSLSAFRRRAASGIDAAGRHPSYGRRQRDRGEDGYAVSEAPPAAARDALARRSLSQFGGSRAMALQTKRADVVQIAFAAAFHHREDMIGIPEGLPESRRVDPQSSSAFSRAAPRRRFSCRSACKQSTPQRAQMPRSRSSTFSRI